MTRSCALVDEVSHAAFFLGNTLWFSVKRKRAMRVAVVVNPSSISVLLRRQLAARLGLEPRQNESESFVLPLHHRAVELCRACVRGGAGDGIRTRNRLFTKQVLYR